MSTLVPNNPSLPPALQPPVQPYLGGWVNIDLTLQQRLLGLSLVGTVHPFKKWVKGNPDTEEWQAEFMWGRPDGRKVVNAWLINLESSPSGVISLDDSQWFTQRSSILLQGFYEIEDPYSWDVWQTMLQQVSQMLTFGDRTMNGNCLTHSLPQAAESVFTSFCGVDCHAIELKFTFEEGGRTGFWIPQTTDYSTTSATAHAIATGSANLTDDSSILTGDAT